MKPREKLYWTVLDYGGERHYEAKFLNFCLVTLDFLGYLLFLAAVDVASKLHPCAERMIAYWEARKAPPMTYEEAQQAHTAWMRALLDKLHGDLKR